MHEWWREHRPAAPGLFLTELANAYEMLLTAPESGAPYGSHRDVLVRRMLLRRSHFHVYYLVDDQGPLVIAVCSSARASGPRFGSTH